MTDPNNQSRPRRYSASNSQKSDFSQGHNTIVNTDSDDKIERIYHEFDKIAFFLGFYGDSDSEEPDLIVNHGRGDKIGESSRNVDCN